MIYFTRLSLPIFWAAVITFSHIIYGASISADGTPSGFIRPSLPARKKTDFNGIFSDIKNHKVTPLHGRESIVQRDVPSAPNFFSLAFGPINAANNADGFMGFVSLPTFDVASCADHCNTRAFVTTNPLDNGGPCIFFNLWTAVVNGTATANICSMYTTVTDSSTATNTGQGNLLVTNSLGYSRISLIQDGSFQDFTCIITQTNGCPFVPSAFWTRFFDPSVQYDFVLVNNFGGHSGTSSADFFFGPPTPDSIASGSSLTYALPLGTVPGTSYVISLFVTNSNLFPAPANLTGALMSVLWNGVDVLDAVQVGPETFNGLTFFNIQATVVAKGSDTFVLKNGGAFAHAMFVDDIALFQKWF